MEQKMGVLTNILRSAVVANIMVASAISGEGVVDQELVSGARIVEGMVDGLQVPVTLRRMDEVFGQGFRSLDESTAARLGAGEACEINELLCDELRYRWESESARWVGKESPSVEKSVDVEGLSAIVDLLRGRRGYSDRDGVRNHLQLRVQAIPPQLKGDALAEHSSAVLQRIQEWIHYGDSILAGRVVDDADQGRRLVAGVFSTLGRAIAGPVDWATGLRAFMLAVMGIGVLRQGRFFASSEESYPLALRLVDYTYQRFRLRFSYLISPDVQIMYPGNELEYLGRIFFLPNVEVALQNEIDGNPNYRARYNLDHIVMAASWFRNGQVVEITPETVGVRVSGGGMQVVDSSECHGLACLMFTIQAQRNSVPEGGH
jgi:hypothetical protein